MSDAAILAPANFRDSAVARNASMFRLEITVDYSSVKDRWERMARRGACLAFQRSAYLSSWYATLGASPDTLPLLVTIIDTRDNSDVLALPLIRRQYKNVAAIEFADGGLTDYNAPILGASAPRDSAGAEQLWTTLRNNLPAGDILRLVKMPRLVCGLPNPLTLISAARPSKFNGNILTVDGAWNDWHWNLEKTFRKELERSWRLFEKHEGATFRQIHDPREAAVIMGELKRLQSARIRELGLPYVLDLPTNERFYDSLLQDGLADNQSILTALSVGNVVVAALLGIANEDHYSMVRLATAGAEWKNCSPGRLMIERTMKALHAQGFRTFDFTIGDYAYKRRFGTTSAPLCEIETALSLRGLPLVLANRAKAAIKNSPVAAKFAARIRRSI